jgi:hypothetical protein
MATMTTRGAPTSTSTAGFGLTDVDEAAYQRLVLQLHHDLPRGEKRRMVLVTTANAAPQLAAAGLAVAYSLAEELQQPVLCVDVHLKGGDASRMMGCLAAPGFTDLLLDPNLRVSDLALPTSHPKLHFMPAGVAGAGRPRSPEHIEHCLGLLDASHDFVVLVGGSVLDDTVALSITPHPGSVLLIGFENETLLADLDQAQRALRFCRARQIGLVIGTSGRS